MIWKHLLCAERFGQHHNAEVNQNDIRTEFQRDFDRLIFSSPFRRLQNKTQVLPLPGSVFVHNRLTHSLEVSCVGRSLGNIVYDKIAHTLDTNEKELVREIGTVISTACLAHDLGNPPFGHSGEKAISEFFVSGRGSEIKDRISIGEYNDLIRFEGNANLIRLLTHQFNGRRKGGYALTFATLGSMIKYPFGSGLNQEKNKYGYFQTEKETFELIMSKLYVPNIDSSKRIFARHPLVYLVEAADDICYQIMDLEDAYKLKILSKQAVHDLFIGFFEENRDIKTRDKISKTMTEVADPNEQMAYLRAIAINKLVHEAASVFADNYNSIMDGTYRGKLLNDMSDEMKKAMKRCSEVAFRDVYRHPSVVMIEITGYNVLGFLMDEFYRAVLYKESDYFEKMLSLFPAQYKVENGTDYEKVRSVVDFVSGMTDIYAVDLYKQIRGLEL